MVDFKKEKNFAGLDSVKIQTDNGEFEVSLEDNNCLYIGFCVPNEDKIPKEQTFKITNENCVLYELINNLFESFENTKGLEEYLEKFDNELLIKMIKRDNPCRDGKITWYSDDFPIEEASKLIISKNDNDNSFEFTFIKSNSKRCVNTYFVCIGNKMSRYHIFNVPFMNFYKNLRIYEKYNQIVRVKDKK